MAFRSLLVPFFCLALAGSASGKTLLILQSEPGDFIGGGVDRSFDSDDGTYAATRNGGDGVTVTFDATNDDFTLDFSAPGDVDLAVQPYLDATRYPFNEIDEPGLAVFGNGNGCNQLRGKFLVSEIAYGAGDAIDAFAADFVQYCDGSAHPLVGAIRFNANENLPDFIDDDVDGVADVVDNCFMPNPEQQDSDLDGNGDGCDGTLEASFVLFDSQAGDYVGQGARRVWHAGNAVLQVDLDGPGALRIQLEGAESYDLYFEAPGGGVPPVGVYENATRYPFNSDVEPGLDASGEGRGCGDLTGRFEVFESEVVDGQVVRFSADFERTCGGSTGPLDGAVRWRAAFRPLAGDHDGDGALTKEDNCPGVSNPPQVDTDGDGGGDGCLSKAGQKCVNDMNKATANLVKLHRTANLACLKNAAKGKTEKLGTPATAQDCLSNDVGGKIAKGAAKLAARAASSCATPPDFGYTSPAYITARTADHELGLMSDLFGPNLDASLVSAAADPVGAKCQEEVVKRASAASAVLWKLTLKQKKAVLLGTKTLGATTETLGNTLVDPVSSDPKGAVTKTFSALSAGAAKSCTGQPVATRFPGCAPADLDALAACTRRTVLCRFCFTLDEADGTSIDCDLFDNDTADGSCQEGP
jgi:hypothetical protein